MDDEMLWTTKDIANWARVGSQRVATWREQGMPHYDLCEAGTMVHTYRYESAKVKEWFEERFAMME